MPQLQSVLRGEACEACKGGEFWHALEKKCYPGWSARAVLVAEAYVHQWLGTYRKCVDRFLAPSQFVRDKFVEHGWDQRSSKSFPTFSWRRLRLRLHPKAPPSCISDDCRQKKGLTIYCTRCSSCRNTVLTIAGDGPERGRLQELADRLGLLNVQFVGQLSRTELDRAIVGFMFHRVAVACL